MKFPWKFGQKPLKLRSVYANILKEIGTNSQDNAVYYCTAFSLVCQSLFSEIQIFIAAFRGCRLNTAAFLFYVGTSAVFAPLRQYGRIFLFLYGGGRKQERSSPK
ncbi:MAG: hypothetical protein ACOYJR_05885 [Acutalibacteraceae bacterium]|jgi:hypothetical protein